MAEIEIVDLPDDEKITEPGFYRMSLDRHHNQPCDGVSVTSSVLRNMELRSPGYVWDFHVLNPKRFKPKETRAQTLGRAMAYMIEGGVREVKKNFVIEGPHTPKRPTKTQVEAFQRTGVWSDKAAEGAVFWAKADKAGKEKLTATEYEELLLMAKVLTEDPAAKAVLTGDPEITMADWDEENKLWLLSRPDNLRLDGTLSDYKRISTQGRPFKPHMVDRRITDYRYDMQMAFAAEVYANLTRAWPQSVGLVFQEDNVPYHVILRGLLEDALRKGMWCNRDQRIRFRECLDSGHWPRDGEVIGNYNMPDWLDQMLMERMAVGGTHDTLKPSGDVQV